MEDKTLVDVLSKLAVYSGNANGRVILEDGERFMAKFMDFSGGKFKADAKIIGEFLVSVQAMTMKSAGVIDGETLHDLAERFHEDTLYDTSACVMAVAAVAWLEGLIDRAAFEKAAVKAAVKSEAPKKAAVEVHFPDLAPHPEEAGTIGLIMDVSMEVVVELGRTRKLIKEILSFKEGAIMELDKFAGEPVDVLVNHKLIAKGEIVVVDENFGVRFTEIVSPLERMKEMG